jgi:GNAT superfamily N-acetyltransferase
MTATFLPVTGLVRRHFLDSRRAWRTGGTRAVAREWREALIFPLIRHGQGTVVEHDLNHITPTQVPKGVEISIRSGGDSVADFAHIANARTIHGFERALSRGRTCVTALRSGRVIGFVWNSLQIESDLEIYPIRLPPQTAYGWGPYVIPSERTRGVGSALVSARLELARSLDCMRSWRLIDADYTPIIRTLGKTLGPDARVVGEIKFVKILRWSFGRLDVRPTTGGLSESALVHDSGCRVP